MKYFSSSSYSQCWSGASHLVCPQHSCTANHFWYMLLWHLLCAISLPLCPPISPLSWHRLSALQFPHCHDTPSALQFLHCHDIAPLPSNFPIIMTPPLCPPISPLSWHHPPISLLSWHRSSSLQYPHCHDTTLCPPISLLSWHAQRMWSILFSRN